MVFITESHQTSAQTARKYKRQMSLSAENKTSPQENSQQSRALPVKRTDFYKGCVREQEVSEPILAQLAT